MQSYVTILYNGSCSFWVRTEVEETNDDLSTAPFTRHVWETGYLALYEKITCHRGRKRQLTT